MTNLLTLIVLISTVFLTACAPKLEVVETYSNGAKKTSVQFLGDGVEGTRTRAFVFHYSPQGELKKRENLIKKVTEYYPDLHRPLSRIEGLNQFLEGEWSNTSASEDPLVNLQTKMISKNQRVVVLSLTQLDGDAITTLIENTEQTMGDETLLVMSPHHSEGKYACILTSSKNANDPQTLDNAIRDGSDFLDNQCFIEDGITFHIQNTTYTRNSPPKGYPKGQ